MLEIDSAQVELVDALRQDVRKAEVDRANFRVVRQANPPQSFSQTMLIDEILVCIHLDAFRR